MACGFRESAACRGARVTDRRVCKQEAGPKKQEQQVKPWSQKVGPEMTDSEEGVHAENFLVDYCRDGEAVEHVGERLPQFDVVPPLA